MRNTPLPAKLARPRLFDAVDRTRLFEVLDARVERPLVWISGPPGSGKTTLVTSYLARERVPTLWYRLDEDDVDAASFFSYLTLATRALSRKRNLALPALTSEYLLDLPTFTRRYFRTLYEALPNGTSLVLDAYEAVSGSGIDALLSIAVNEAPPGTRLWVTSREAPPQALVHLETKGALLPVSWEALRLSVEEAQAIAAATGGRPEEAETLRKIADGWAAGFVVLLDHVRRSGTAALERFAPAREVLFPYFVNEMFSRADATLRAMLIKTAVMPGFTAAQAQTLCPEADASVLLERLYRRHYFLDRSTGPAPVYRYHALFQEFLIAQGDAALDARARRSLLEQAARLLEAAGRIEDALDAFTQAQAWPQAARLINELAPAVLSQGRNAVLDKAICALPQSVVDASAWLQYWLGSARILFNPSAGRTLLEKAYEQFAAAADHTGCVMTCAGMCESYYLEWSDLHPFYDWANRLDEYMQLQGPFPSLAMEIRVVCALSLDLFVVYRADGRLERWNARAVALALQLEDPSAQLVVASSVCFPLIARGDWNTVRQLVAAIGDREIESVVPISKILWQLCLCWIGQQHGADEDARRASERAAAIAERYGVRVLEMLIAGHAAFAALNARDLPRISASVERMRRLLDPARRLDVANFEHMMSLVLVVQAEPQRAEGYARAAMEKTSACGTPFLLAQCRIGLASALIESGKYDEAIDVADAIIDFGKGAGFKTLYHAGLLLKAGALHGSNRTAEGLPVLQSALTMGRENGFGTMFPTAPEPFLQRMFDLALVHDIERNYVRELVRKLHVAAPKHASEHWPWPVRILALGRFEIEVDGASIEYRRKVPKRPLALLKFVLSRRGEARVEQAIDALWPDEEGDAASNALDAALHRLRRLLGGRPALELQDGHLRLNRNLVWVDAFAFDAADTAEREPAGAFERSLRLYRGHFLGGDLEEPWSVSMRERLRSRYIRAVVSHGQALQTDGKQEAAAAHYERALDLDDLIEAFHQGIMQCRLALKQRSEGLAAYERLRRTLEAELKLAPSAVSEQMREQLRAL